MKKICMIGSGAWGTAVATVLAHNGHEVIVWCHNEAVAQDINTKHKNSKYLPDVFLHKNISATTNLAPAMEQARWIFEATPMTYLRETLQNARKQYQKEQIFVMLSKGIDRQSALLPTQIVDEIFGPRTAKAVCVGPSFAQEVAAQKVTGVIVASDNQAVAGELQSLLANDYFYPEISSDMIGAQIGAAFKNVMALGVGLLEGAQYGDNAKALFITRALAEMVLIAKKMGGKEETLYGLSGLGDLILTTGSVQSRNLAIGKLVGAGQSLEEALKTTGLTAEGANTVQSLRLLTQKLKLELPLSSGIYAVLFEKKSVQDLVRRMK
jgi:glycerol-3-phosphate dehydrogenase (NAD(P)+)